MKRFPLLAVIEAVLAAACLVSIAFAIRTPSEGVRIGLAFTAVVAGGAALVFLFVRRSHFAKEVSRKEQKRSAMLRHLLFSEEIGTVLLVYTGSKKRICDPLPKDKFFVQMYRTKDADAVRAHEARENTADEEHLAFEKAYVVPDLYAAALDELTALTGKTVLMDQELYEAAAAPRYARLTERNTVLALGG